MSQETPAARTVLILGRGVVDGAIGFAERAVRLGGELVLLSLGHPVTEKQQAVVTGALALVAESRTALDAVLVPDVGDLTRYLAPDDRVAVFSSGLERRTIERAVRQTGGQDSVAGEARSSARRSDSSRRTSSAS